MLYSKDITLLLARGSFDRFKIGCQIPTWRKKQLAGCSLASSSRIPGTGRQDKCVKSGGPETRSDDSNKPPPE